MKAKFLTILLCATTLLVSAQDEKPNIMASDKMKIEIWSDVVCPFCYVGKRHLESALEQFDHKDEVEIVWKSYQLYPNLSVPADSSISSYEYIAQSKGISYDESVGLHNYVTEMGSKAGLDIQFEKSIVANTTNAHRVLQFAKQKGLGDEAKESLLKAYFTEGKNISDQQTLIELGVEIGLSQEEVKIALTDDYYAQLLSRDVQESQNIGVNGVPFFVLDRKYGISGAQPVDHFLQTIEQAHTNWKAKQTPTELQMSEGKVCRPDGQCD